MRKQLQQELQARIEAFASDVTSLLQEAVAQGVAEALASTSVRAPARSGATKKSAKKSAPKKRAAKKRGKKKTGEKRPPAEIAKLEKALYREIKRDAGRRIEQIAESMGTTTHELKVPMQHLLGEKRVKAKGQARATRYTAR
jgi:hypothetical protein